MSDGSVDTRQGRGVASGVNEKEKTQSGTGSLQREAGGHEVKTEKLRKEIKAIREGHRTGGYCETEELHAQEKALWRILSEDLEAAKKKHGYSPDPKFKHAEVRALELEINGLSWKPQLVVAHEGN